MILKTTDSESHVSFVLALFGTLPEERLCRQLRWLWRSGNVHAPRQLLDYGLYDHTACSTIVMQDGSFRWATEATAAETAKPPPLPPVEMDESRCMDEPRWTTEMDPWVIASRITHMGPWIAPWFVNPFRLP